ncbi:MAG: Xaa-Pro peptidase family protein [Halobacteriales archaeon]|nr:Xaa-Pro peptidase family protein [Halobacteriales archaeon]
MTPAPTLPDLEYDNRIAALREEMAAKEYDVFVVYADEYRPGDAFYLSNFKPINVLEEAHQMVVVPLDADPILLTGTLNSYGARERSWVEDVRPFDTLPETLAEVVEVQDAETVGLAGEKLFPVRYYERFADAIPDQEIVRDDELLAQLRWHKSEAEIRMLEESGRIGDESIVEVVEALEPGVTEADLAAVGEYGAQKRSAEIGSAYVIIAGENTRHPTWRPSPDVTVEDGDYVIIDASPQYRGYAADVAITAIAGEADDEKRETLQRANEVTHQIIEEDIYPGMVASELYDRVRERVAEEGWMDEWEPWARGVRAVGHGVGIDVVEYPNLGPDVDQTLDPGSVLSLKFDLHGIVGGGLRVERMLTIGDSGARGINFTGDVPDSVAQFL